MAHATGERILAEAMEIFAEDGLDAVTMRAVAARAGVSPMAIYRHYAGRAELVRGLVGEAQALFLNFLQQAQGEADAWGRLAASGRAYLRFALEHPRAYALIFLEPLTPAGARRGGARQAWQDAATFRFLVDRIRECDDAGLLAAPDPEAAALTIWAQVHGLVTLYLTGKLAVGRAAFEALYAESLGRLVKAFAAPPAPPLYTT